MTEATTRPRLSELLKSKDFSVRALNPESEKDFAIARELDLASLEAYNPFSQESDPAAAHDAMTDRQLKRWMKDRQTGMLRVVEVDNQAIGFIYLYNDAKTDVDFRARAQAVRQREGLPSNHSVCEANFRFYEGARDDVVEKSVGQVLGEFSESRKREATTLMFADAGDVREAFEEKVKRPATLRELNRALNRKTAEDAFQDTRILKRLGFHFVDRLRYDATSRILDFAYALRVGK